MFDISKVSIGTQHIKTYWYYYPYHLVRREPEGKPVGSLKLSLLASPIQVRTLARMGDKDDKTKVRIKIVLANSWDYAP